MFSTEIVQTQKVTKVESPANRVLPTMSMGLNQSNQQPTCPANNSFFFFTNMVLPPVPTNMGNSKRTHLPHTFHASRGSAPRFTGPSPCRAREERLAARALAESQWREVAESCHRCPFRLQIDGFPWYRVKHQVNQESKPIYSSTKTTKRTPMAVACFAGHLVLLKGHA